MEVKYITSEYVGKGHPDKLADLISDMIVGELYDKDEKSRCGVETLVKDNHVVLGGEIKTNSSTLSINKCVKDAFEIVAYPKSHKELQFDNILIENFIGRQSREIDDGITNDEEIGAGDQGFVVGYASNETSEYLPLGAYIAKKIVIGLNGSQSWIGPDMKSQVIVKYIDGVATEIDSILVSTMHDESINVHDVREYVIEFIKTSGHLFDENIFNKFIVPLENEKIIVNPCGDWNIGGPISDCGVTGRKIVVDQYGGYANVGGGAMCVDGETEYIGDDLKWHKISEYSGEKVGQWNNGVLEFVTPLKYHSNPSEKMYQFLSPNSIDMVLSENHEIVAKTSKNNIHKIKVKDVLEKLNNGGVFKDAIPCTFEYYPQNKGIDLTDNQIRLQVAFCADGTYSSLPNNKGRINIKKKNKIQRLEWLLKETNTDYHLLDKGEYQNHYYTFIPPVPNNKSLYSIFKNANTHQLLILAKEVVKWDGDEKKGIFRTTNKEDADFIQFVFNSIYNTHSYILEDNRVGRIKTTSNKEYKIKSKCYTVGIGKIKEISFGGCKPKLNISDFKCERMYCFTVPSGMLLLRRNNNVFVTGNCGKDMTKVDRSGAYMARYLAKNIVAANLCSSAKVTISYAIATPNPLSINVDMENAVIDSNSVAKWIIDNIDLTPNGIIKRFPMSKDIFVSTALNGHFGVKEYPWEKLDIATKLEEHFFGKRG